MKSSGRSLSLTSYDDPFATEESRADADREKVMEIPLSELFPFKDHPFKVRDDDKMADTAESIREYSFLLCFIIAGQYISDERAANLTDPVGHL